MNAKEFYRKNKETISAPLDDNWMENAVSQMMEAYLAHKIEEAEKANPYKSRETSFVDGKFHGYNAALNKLKEL